MELQLCKSAVAVSLPKCRRTNGHTRERIGPLRPGVLGLLEELRKGAVRHAVLLSNLPILGLPVPKVAIDKARRVVPYYEVNIWWSIPLLVSATEVVWYLVPCYPSWRA